MKYINNKNLLKELRYFKKNNEKTERLGEMFLLLAKRYSDKGCFYGYTWKDDMIGEAVYTCIRYMHNFDPEIENPNPFAYFSRIIHNSFLNYISKQKIHSTIKDLCYKNIDLIIPDNDDDDDREKFKITSIDYQQIRGKKKKRKKKKK